MGRGGGRGGDDFPWCSLTLHLPPPYRAPVPAPPPHVAIKEACRSSGGYGVGVGGVGGGGLERCDRSSAATGARPPVPEFRQLRSGSPAPVLVPPLCPHPAPARSSANKNASSMTSCCTGPPHPLQPGHSSPIPPYPSSTEPVTSTPPAPTDYPQPPAQCPPVMRT